MATELHERTVVNGGRIDLPPIDLPDGTEVEVTVAVANVDETEYLLSGEANRDRLLEVIRDARAHPDRKIYVDIDELKKSLMAF
jgi:antitoxin YefM